VSETVMFVEMLAVVAAIFYALWLLGIGRKKKR